MYRVMFAIGCVCGAVGVASGAAGAHRFQTELAPAAFASYTTAVDYLLWHAVALVGLAAWFRSAKSASRLQLISVAGIIVGITLFSGGLFGWTLAEWAWARRCAPWGGSTLILAWLALAASTWQTGTVANH